jgi:cytochrome c-type biogenesis protein CcsB
MTLQFAICFWIMMVLYALAVGGLLGDLILRLRHVGRWSSRILAVGLTLHSALVAWRWVQTGHIPTVGNFENALFGGWFIVAMTAWAAWSERSAVLAAAALPFALVVLGGGALSDTSPQPFVASLNSMWLYIHIFFAWLAYGAYTVACGAGIVYLAKTRGGREPGAEARGPLDEIMFRATAFGFVTDGIMIAAGSIWAKDLWGSYWSWDPVETWSLLSWIVYGLALHLRTTLGWRGRPLAWLLVVAVVTVIISFWGVNLVMSGSSHLFNVG